jgi:hypothetical protein
MSGEKKKKRSNFAFLKRRKEDPLLVANGRRRRRLFYTSSHFSPKQLYLDLHFFPLILRFYFTMVLGLYLRLFSLSLGL